MLGLGSYVVLDTSNTTGVFSLGDDSDYIRLWCGDRDTFWLRYPGDPSSPERSWITPPGQSCALFQRWEYVPPGEWMDCYAWYVDETPTFGQRNDDTLGGILGMVFGGGHGPLNDATVLMLSTQGTAVVMSGWGWNWPDGYFEQKPTGPGSFVVSVECDSYLPYVYPETIELAPNEAREIDVYLQRPGAAAE
jgi:hypothetical protein